MTKPMNLIQNYFFVQAVVFERSNYEGEYLHICTDVYNLHEKPADGRHGKEDKKRRKWSTVGSIKILGGL